MVVFGTRLFGEVDEVPGLFAVRTRFFHINFLPLIPTKSFLMFGPERGVELSSVQWRSVLASWARVALVVGGAVALIVGAITLGQTGEAAAGIGELLAAALCGAGMWASYRYTRATRERALELCELAKLPEEARRDVEKHFGKLARGGAEEF